MTDAEPVPRPLVRWAACVPFLRMMIRPSVPVNVEHVLDHPTRMVDLAVGRIRRRCTDPQITASRGVHASRVLAIIGKG